MRSFENVEIFNPSTAEQVDAITSVLAHGFLPAYLRLGSLDKSEKKMIRNIADFAQVLHFGVSGSILTTGPVLTQAEEAREILAEEGYDLGIISVYNLSRFDLMEIMNVCPGPFVSVEEHRMPGGFNSMILENANLLQTTVAISGVGIKDFKHSEVGSRDYMLTTYGVTAQGIVRSFHQLVD
jgi:transketolase C-terminal domain/subunit